MILLITRDSDRAIEKIIDWLNFENANYYRGTIEELFLNCSITIKKNDQLLDLFVNGAKVNCVFIRQFKYLEYSLSEIVGNDDIRKFLSDESTTLLSSFRQNYSFKIFPFFDKIRSNKIYNLSIAEQVGIHIPQYIITNLKSELLHFKNQYNHIICKAISNGARTTYKGKSLFSYVDIVTSQMMDKVDENFFISFFQEYIQKEFELRIFFIDDQFYAMAIMSQESQRTAIDFRKYNKKRWNRNVPYKLDEKILKKLNLLMARLKLSTGSIDMIKSTDGKYYFLEVNPIGQFGMTSEPCNFNLDKIIAEKLIKYDTERNRKNSRLHTQ